VGEGQRLGCHHPYHYTADQAGPPVAAMPSSWARSSPAVASASSFSPSMRSRWARAGDFRHHAAEATYARSAGYRPVGQDPANRRAAGGWRLDDATAVSSQLV